MKVVLDFPPGGGGVGGLVSCRQNAVGGRGSEGVKAALWPVDVRKKSQAVRLLW